MLSVGRLSSAEGAAGYLVKGGEGHAAGYFMKQQAQSHWAGGAKEALKLPDGPVDLKTLERILDGRISDTQTLGRKIKGVRHRDPGRDFTFSAPKSVSLAAIGEMKEPITNAMQSAVAKTMEYYEKNLAQARIYNKDSGKQVRTGNQKITYASFTDLISRANDPQFHIHNAVSNLAIGEDGKIRSLDFKLAYKHKILLGSIFRAELAKEMQALGFKIRPAGKHGLWELAGSQDEILKTFSKRRTDMTRQAPHKTGDAKAMAKLALTTRPSKVKLTQDTLLTRWNSELEKLGTSTQNLIETFKSAPSPDLQKLTPETALDYARDYHAENERHFDKYAFLRTAMTRVYGHVDIKAMESELEQRLHKDELRISDDGRWLVTTKTLNTEHSILGELDKGHLQARVLSRKDFQNLRGFETLTPGQKNAGELILTDYERFVGVKGMAGTGKTFMQELTLPHLKALGYELVGIAPSHKALSALESTGVFDKAMTTQRYQNNPYGHSKTVLVIDEASMVGNEAMRSIMNFANVKNMPRVVFIGDPEQLGSIEAGRPFELLLEKGLRHTNMNDIIRQRSKRHIKGIQALAKGELREAFQTLNKEIYETLPQDLIAKALELRKKMDDPAIVVATNKEREHINQTIKHEKQNTGPGIKLNVWNTLHLKKAEKVLVESYDQATHIKFNRDVGKTFKRGEVYKIKTIDKRKARLILTDGKTSKSFSPARHGSGNSFTQVLRQSQIILHKEDKIKFRTTNKKLGISNNDFGTVAGITPTHVQIKLGNNKTLSLAHKDKLLSHIDYGWANTVHSFQGATVKDNIAIMRADNNPLNTLEALYVGASRHREKLAIVTDNKERLLHVISEKVEISREKIEFKEPDRMRVVEPQNQPQRQRGERER